MQRRRSATALYFLWIACLLGAEGFSREVTYTPHLISNIVPKPPPVFPGSKWAEIFGIYEVETNDWDAVKKRITQRLAVSLENISPDHLELSYVQKLADGARCRADLLRCSGLGASGTIRDADPRKCGGIGDLSDKITKADEWMPQWTDDTDLENQVWNIPVNGKYLNYMCVSETNTSLLKFPQGFILNNTFITGARNQANSRLYSSPTQNLSLHIVGVIPIPWAKFLNAKFQMDGAIPLPERQPEVVDEFATHTDDLNITIRIFGVREIMIEGTQPPNKLGTYMKTCPEPTLMVKGCFRIDHNFYEHPRITYYKLKYRILWNRHIFGETASDNGKRVPFKRCEKQEAATDKGCIFRDQIRLCCKSSETAPENDMQVGQNFWETGSHFNVSRGPWPTFEMMKDPHQNQVGPWFVHVFPQKEWRHQEACKFGVACSNIPLAPSPRYMHSASLYTTWNFHFDAWKFLCNQNPACGSTCLIDLTCLGGNKFYDGNFFFRSEQFKADDGEVEPFLSLDNIDCPKDCCRDRRLCLRKYDVLGYEVPFEATYMLVFGGKTYLHVKDQDGKLIYHSCEGDTVQNSLKTREDWRSCEEIITNEMWRYDLKRGKWEYVKTDSGISPTTGKAVGWPLARYGHASTYVRTIENNEGFTRLWLYIYGGLGPQCEGGVCNDVWKYEIPWAAQAYYPKFPDGEWNRGNQWYRLKDCQFGGRYSHDMVTTSAMEYIYIYGGQGINEYFGRVFRYRISTDFWEDLQPYGRISLTRLMYDYVGSPLQFDVATHEFDPKVDVDCRLAFGSDKKEWRHCQICPNCRLTVGREAEKALVPSARVNFAMTYFFESDDAADDSLLVFGGFRTTWGAEDTAKRSCSVTTTTTTITVFTSTTLEDGFKPIPPGPTVTTRTTTTTTSTTSTRTSTTTTTRAAATTVTTGTVTITTTSRTTTSTTTSTTTTVTTTIVTTTTVTTTTVTTTTSTTTTTTTTTTSTSTSGDGKPYCAPDQSKKNKSAEGFEDFVKSQAQSDPQCDDQEDPFSDNSSKYYFQDTWKYDATVNQWLEVRTIDRQGAKPEARRGARMVARNSRTNDTTIIVFGGHVQDTAFNDMWILDTQQQNSAGVWTRLNQFFVGMQPPTMTYHTMLYDNKTDQIIVFGGIHWKPTDLDTSDARRNVDRRCMKEAQELGETWNGLSAKHPWDEKRFLRYITGRCQQNQFCCTLAGLEVGQGRTFNGIDIRPAINAPLCLMNVSVVCRQDCEKKAFKPVFYPIMVEGVWTFSPNRCQSNCGGHGSCEMSQCTCEVGWYGADCLSKRCPGSSCYTHPYTKEQHCVACSQHGQCIDGECVCYPGWGYDDCSAILCENNCSSNHLVTRGICVEDFPVHQCVCLGKWAGVLCDRALCLNDCSGRGECIQGVCKCQKYFHGEDCSLWAFPLKSADTYSSTLTKWDWQGLDEPVKTYGYTDIIAMESEIKTTTTLAPR